MKLRDYQLKAVEAVECGFKQFGKQIAVLPTGAGKTILFAHLAKRQLPGCTLILAHREELVDQAIDKLRAATGIVAAKEMASDHADIDAPVVVGSVQSMIRRLDKWPADAFSLVVCDEAHHAISDSWQRVLRHFDDRAKVLGVTATPDRGDKRNLGQYFENVACEVSLFDLVQQGYLSRIHYRSVPLQIDLAGVRQAAGDYRPDDLGNALEPYLDSIAAAIVEHAGFTKTLAFLPLIATSKAFVQACRAQGLEAEHIDGTDPDRAAKRQAFARGEYDLMSNAMLWTEGFDDPSIGCVVVLRPTRSRPLYSQMVGRGTRISPGKDHLLLLDFLWMHEKHNLIRPAHLIAKDEREAETITELAMERSPAALNGELDLQNLHSEARAKREEKLRRDIELNRHKKGRLIDAVEFCMAMGDSDAAEYEPVMKWETQGATDKQLRFLKRNKVDPDTIQGRGHASKVIDLIMRNQTLKLASPGQRRLMQRMGFPEAERATADQARKFFAEMRGAAT